MGYYFYNKTRVREVRRTNYFRGAGGEIREFFMLRDFTKEKFDVIILAGQSNAEGYGFGDVESPYEPTPDVWCMNDDFSIKKLYTIAPAVEMVTKNEVQSHLGLTFAAEYLKAGRLTEGRKLLILRAASGGSGFANNRWHLTDDLYIRMIDMIDTALELNPENRLVALLWHQGETDALAEAGFDLHYGNLSTLLSSVREKYGCENLPFIAGDFVHHWSRTGVKTPEKCAPVLQAIRAVCRDMGPAKFVETDGLFSNKEAYDALKWNPGGWEDSIHFSRRGVYELGRRYFKAFSEIEN